MPTKIELTLEKSQEGVSNDVLKEESRNIDRELALEKQAQQLEPKLYDGSVIQKTDAIVIRDSEETLMLEDESRSKMLQKQKDPMMSEKKNFGNSIESNLFSSTTIVGVPKELPKVSMVNSSLKMLKFHLASFDMKIKRELEEIETINIELDHRVTKLVAENEHLKQTYKQLYDSIKSSRVRSKEQCDTLIKQVNIKSAENSALNASLQEKVLVITALKDTLSKLKGKVMVNEAVPLHSIDPELLKIDVSSLAPKLRNNKTAHNDYLKHTQEETATLREIVENERLLNSLNTSLDYVCKYTKRIQELLIIHKQTCPCINDLGTKLMAVTPVNNNKKIRFTEHILSSGNTPIKTTSSTNNFLGTVKFGNDHVTKIMGYGDYKIGNVTISRVYFVEGLGHNLFYVGQFCDSDLEVAFRQHICFIRNLDGVDLLTGSRGNNLYTLSLKDMMASSPICLLSKASKTKSWLWHRRLSHLNFGAINHLARQGLVRGLSKLKFEKDHLCSACVMGKSKKKSHKPKSEDTNQEKLYLLHMDLCGPMRVESVNRKKYILVIVNDYSRFTGVKCLRSKDEAPDFIIRFLKMIQVRLKVPVRQAVATACYTQNRSIIRLHHGKTPYELLHNKLPDLSFLNVFGALCYLTNDSENLGKLQPNADIGIFIGYAPTKKAF
nr:retrovirus-related Pol polyprotein from transposon TNT 1-94 [Tanacetum cinerariifolium]